MKRRSRGWIVVVAVLSAINGAAIARATSESGPTRYTKVAGPDTMPYHIALTRSCRNTEDTMATLRVVDYTPERVLYRCARP